MSRLQSPQLSIQRQESRLEAAVLSAYAQHRRKELISYRGYCAAADGLYSVNYALGIGDMVRILTGFNVVKYPLQSGHKMPLTRSSHNAIDVICGISTRGDGKGQFGDIGYPTCRL